MIHYLCNCEFHTQVEMEDVLQLKLNQNGFNNNWLDTKTMNQMLSRNSLLLFTWKKCSTIVACTRNERQTCKKMRQAVWDNQIYLYYVVTGKAKAHTEDGTECCAVLW